MAPYHRISVRVLSSLPGRRVSSTAGWSGRRRTARGTARKPARLLVDTFNTRLGTTEEVAVAVSRVDASRAAIAVCT